ncbi:PH domain-containing protein [Chryseobacterium vrystaatense]|uniref:Short C-terminal domain-containing protein n=1 Tax=Chryseobacterium vrystaatense TaxID=307480 RepID=A0ABR4UMC0_9FLAO|nr:PH domain-containing protein [Chryseobacterium vrystaatense]KFF26078.1 hypothetical protein IW16_14600 [Chryseobacterium vrystaatense]
MSNTCALCNAELTSIDTLLGENKLLDGGNLCNKCLDKVSSINQELLYNLSTFSIHNIKSLVQNGKTEPENLSQEKSIEPGVSKFEGTQPGLVSSSADSRKFYKRRLKEIKYELEQVNANLSIFTKGEIKELPGILSANERIIAATDAQLLKSLDAGVLLVTHQRMLSVSKGMFSNVIVNEYPNETINEVSIVNNPLSPIIKLHTEDKIVQFECFCDREDAERFYSFIKEIYNKPKPHDKTAEATEVSSEAIFSQLEKLGKLRESGILTEQEFAEQKKKLLGQLS